MSITTCQEIEVTHPGLQSFERRAKTIAYLKACSTSKNLEAGKIAHKAAVSTGDESNIYVASTLIHMYSKCGRTQEAKAVFDNLEHPNVVCWNALIFGYAENGQSDTALDLFSRMRREDLDPDVRSIVAALQACADIAVKHADNRRPCERIGKCIHLLALRSGCLDSFVKGTLLNMYSKCGNMNEACKVFNMIVHPDVVCWTGIILGFAENGDGQLALDLFLQMQGKGCTPNAITFVAVIKACIALKEERHKKRIRCRKLHIQSVANGDYDIHVQVTLLDMYAKCGSMEDAHKVFDRVSHPEAVAWTPLILGYAENGDEEIALELFFRMYREGCLPDEQTFVAVFKASVGLSLREEGTMKMASIERAKKLHLLSSRNGCCNVYVQGALVDMFVKCGCIENAKSAFDGMKHPDVVSWTALLSGYTENGKSDLALDMFSRMELCAPNSFTFSVMLKACGILGALEVGKALHARIINSGLRDAVLDNSLMDFYTKCGSMDDAEAVFDSHSGKNLITWNSLIAGYSRLGDTTKVFILFRGMENSSTKPDGVTFMCVLSACGHAGLIDDGMYYFEQMWSKYGIIPNIEHYNCMADMLCRANMLDDALALLRSVPFRLNTIAWMTVLGQCRKRGNVMAGRLAFESLQCLDSDAGGAYVLMANMYDNNKQLCK